MINLSSVLLRAIAQSNGELMRLPVEREQKRSRSPPKQFTSSRFKCADQNVAYLDEQFGVIQRENGNGVLMIVAVVSGTNFIEFFARAPRRFTDCHGVDLDPPSV